MKSFIKQLLREGLEGKVLFHGSTEPNIKKLRGGRGQYGFGIYLTSDEGVADGYGEFHYIVSLRAGDYLDSHYTKEQLVKVLNQADKEGIVLHQWLQGGQLLASNFLYENIEVKLGGTQQASEFLKRAGIDGRIIWGRNDQGNPVQSEELSGQIFVVFNVGNVKILNTQHNSRVPTLDY